MVSRSGLLSRGTYPFSTRNVDFSAEEDAFCVEVSADTCSTEICT